MKRGCAPLAQTELGSKAAPTYIVDQPLRASLNGSTLCLMDFVGILCLVVHVSFHRRDPTMLTMLDSSFR